MYSSKFSSVNNGEYEQFKSINVKNFAIEVVSTVLTGFSNINGIGT